MKQHAVSPVRSPLLTRPQIDVSRGKTHMVFKRGVRATSDLWLPLSPETPLQIPRAPARHCVGVLSSSGSASAALYDCQFQADGRARVPMASRHRSAWPRGGRHAWTPCTPGAGNGAASGISKGTVVPGPAKRRRTWRASTSCSDPMRRRISGGGAGVVGTGVGTRLGCQSRLARYRRRDSGLIPRPPAYTLAACVAFPAAPGEGLACRNLLGGR